MSRNGLTRLPVETTGRLAAALAAFAWLLSCGFASLSAAPVLNKDQGFSAHLLPLHRIQAGGNTPGNFDFYVLALSWSPGFCETQAAGRFANGQCAAGAGQGFVVHGLWPQNEHGYPSNCGPAARFPSRAALDSVAGLYPSESLARHEWQVHGTCSGESPTDYFADVRQAFGKVTIPPAFSAPTEQQSLTPLDVMRAFIAANPRLRPGMLGVTCQDGVLEEVRICLSKDLRDFHFCPDVSRQGCHRHDISVPPPL